MAETRAFDVVIVGAGSAGSVLARRLAESGVATVAVMEAGPDLRRATPADMREGWRLPDIPDWGYRSEADARGETQRIRRGQLVGGTSWLTRFALRGAAADFDAWAAAGSPGWSFEDVLPAFRRIESDAEFGDAPWHGDAGPLPITRYPEIEPATIHAAVLEALMALGVPWVDDHNAPIATGVGRMPFSARGGVRVSASDAFLPAGVALPNLTLRSDSLVVAVIVEGGRARGVRFVDGTEIAADHVILAAGTYGSPTILMRSGVGPSRHLRDVGIDVVVDLVGVGSNLADHPAVSLDTGWRGQGSDGPVLHSVATFSSSRARAGIPDLLLWAADPDGEDVAYEIDVVLMKPASRGTVRLRSPEPTTAPVITLPGLGEAGDVQRLAEGLGLAAEVAGHATIATLSDNPPRIAARSGHALRRAVIDGVYSIPHTVGTCRMGPSPDDGDVVDSMGHVHGVEGLSVIDASVIPEPTAGFPHFVTIMLADLIAERLTARS